MPLPVTVYRVNMSYEVELKYTGVDFTDLRPRLHRLGGVSRGRHWERNIVFDTPQRDLKATGRLLRLRSQQWAQQYGRDRRCVLTLKVPPAQPVPDDVKVWDERETTVAGFDSMRGILEGLGYEAAFRYDKIREEWLCAGVTVCLDTLVFGDVVELEGEREAIFRLAEALGFSGCQATRATYHDLNRQYRLTAGLPQDDNFHFPDDEAALSLLGSIA
ncbi:class IV adenylate cyclase [Oleidesulfovibrio alaskensis]|jgi:adenylate cyclase class 2|nr:class IV adenylate cyclase [Oleidesulfovibrio alaskensis]